MTRRPYRDDDEIVAFNSGSPNQAIKRARIDALIADTKAMLREPVFAERLTPPLRAHHLTGDQHKRACLRAGIAGYFYTREELRHLLSPDPIRDSTAVPDADDWEGGLIDDAEDEKASQDQADVSKD